METFEVLQPGPLTTIQDLGRFGYQQYGVPPSGALDDYAFKIGNMLVGNAENAASLEITLFGSQLRALRDTVIAITGADLGAALNGKPIPRWESILVRRGDIISFPRLNSGCRAYLAVSGGFDVPKVMSSAATYTKAGIGGLEGRALRRGDILHTLKSPATSEGARVPPEYIPVYPHQNELRVILGPQDDYFSEDGIRAFLQADYTISAQADRMGYRLEGPRIEHKLKADIISDGIPLGAVQVPGDGLPIILLVDRQTTGGYTKIATVLSIDIHRLAQAKPGDQVRFRQVTEDEALGYLQEYQQKLQTLRQLLQDSPA
ncbi:MAG TPA: biotin-dependent carboxyltransferase [Dehalococcoidia bacterium]|jgi:biotin-dependent carboxylase-like uncharacterized protein|nr:biotin-dependent carboxyltransferase [Dehalococcoidia bacterium]